MTAYTPIACEFHDRLESWAIRRQPVDVIWTDDDGERQETAVIADVFARDGADWVRLGTGDVFRADALVSVNGVALSDAC